MHACLKHPWPAQRLLLHIVNCFCGYIDARNGEGAVQKLCCFSH